MDDETYYTSSSSSAASEDMVLIKKAKKKKKNEKTKKVKKITSTKKKENKENKNLNEQDSTTKSSETTAKKDDWGFTTNASCDVCGKTSEELFGLLMQCAKCKNANFCSGECYRAGIPKHQQFCSSSGMLVTRDPIGSKVAFTTPKVIEKSDPESKSTKDYDDASSKMKIKTKKSSKIPKDLGNNNADESDNEDEEKIKKKKQLAGRSDDSEGEDIEEFHSKKKKGKKKSKTRTSKRLNSDDVEEDIDSSTVNDDDEDNLNRREYKRSLLGGMNVNGCNDDDDEESDYEGTVKTNKKTLLATKSNDSDVENGVGIEKSKKKKKVKNRSSTKNSDNNNMTSAKNNNDTTIACDESLSKVTTTKNVRLGMDVDDSDEDDGEKSKKKLSLAKISQEDSDEDNVGEDDKNKKKKKIKKEANDFVLLSSRVVSGEADAITSTSIAPRGMNTVHSNADDEGDMLQKKISLSISAKVSEEDVYDEDDDAKKKHIEKKVLFDNSQTEAKKTGKAFNPNNLSSTSTYDVHSTIAETDGGDDDSDEYDDESDVGKKSKKKTNLASNAYDSDDEYDNVDEDRDRKKKKKKKKKAIISTFSNHGLDATETAPTADSYNLNNSHVPETQASKGIEGNDGDFRDGDEEADEGEKGKVKTMLSSNADDSDDDEQSDDNEYRNTNKKKKNPKENRKTKDKYYVSQVDRNVNANGAELDVDKSEVGEELDQVGPIPGVFKFGNNNNTSDDVDKSEISETEVGRRTDSTYALLAGTKNDNEVDLIDEGYKIVEVANPNIMTMSVKRNNSKPKQKFSIGRSNEDKVQKDTTNDLNVDEDGSEYEWEYEEEEEEIVTTTVTTTRKTTVPKRRNFAEIRMDNKYVDDGDEDWSEVDENEGSENDHSKQSLTSATCPGLSSPESDHGNAMTTSKLFGGEQIKRINPDTQNRQPNYRTITPDVCSDETKETTAATRLRPVDLSDVTKKQYNWEKPEWVTKPRRSSLAYTTSSGIEKGNDPYLRSPLKSPISRKWVRPAGSRQGGRRASVTGSAGTMHSMNVDVNVKTNTVVLKPIQSPPTSLVNDTDIGGESVHDSKDQNDDVKNADTLGYRTNVRSPVRLSYAIASPGKRKVGQSLGYMTKGRRASMSGAIGGMGIDLVRNNEHVQRNIMVQQTSPEYAQKRASLKQSTHSYRLAGSDHDDSICETEYDYDYEESFGDSTSPRSPYRQTIAVSSPGSQKWTRVSGSTQQGRSQPSWLLTPRSRSRKYGSRSDNTDRDDSVRESEYDYEYEHSESSPGITSSPVKTPKMKGSSNERRRFSERPMSKSFGDKQAQTDQMFVPFAGENGDVPVRLRPVEQKFQNIKKGKEHKPEWANETRAQQRRRKSLHMVALLEAKIASPSKRKVNNYESKPEWAAEGSKPKPSMLRRSSYAPTSSSLLTSPVKKGIGQDTSKPSWAATGSKPLPSAIRRTSLVVQSSGPGSPSTNSPALSEAEPKQHLPSSLRKSSYSNSLRSSGRSSISVESFLTADEGSSIESRRSLSRQQQQQQEGKQQQLLPSTLRSSTYRGSLRSSTSSNSSYDDCSSIDSRQSETTYYSATSVGNVSLHKQYLETEQRSLATLDSNDDSICETFTESTNNGETEIRQDGQQKIEESSKKGGWKNPKWSRPKAKPVIDDSSNLPDIVRAVKNGNGGGGWAKAKSLLQRNKQATVTSAD